MEVMNENSLGDLKVKAHSATEETSDNENVKCNGDVNGEKVESGDIPHRKCKCLSYCVCNKLDVSRGDEPSDQSCSENGVEAAGEDDVQSQDELPASAEISRSDIPEDNHVSAGEEEDEMEDEEEVGEDVDNSKTILQPDESQDSRQDLGSDDQNPLTGDSALDESMLDEDSSPVPVSIQRVEPENNVESTETSSVHDLPPEDEEEGDEEEDEEDKEEEEDEKFKESDDRKEGEDDVIDLMTPVKDSESGDKDPRTDSTPDKGSSSKKKKSQPITNVTPRRSSRNLNKTKSYVDESEVKSEEDDEIQEVPDAKPVMLQPATTIIKKNTIVVNDTKRLAEIAAGSKAAAAKGGKKEPTLVIIDTNSLLANKSGQVSLTPTIPSRVSVVPVSTAQSLFTAKPVKVPAAVSITPPPSSVVSKPQQLVTTRREVPVPPAVVSQREPVSRSKEFKQVILPSLTDDMFVVEAPSFIVPYVYEKPPVNALKDYLKDLEKKVKLEEAERKKKEEEEEKVREEEERKRKEIQSGGEPTTTVDEQQSQDSTKDKEEEKMEVDKTEEDKKTEEKMEVDEEVETKKEESKEKSGESDKEKEKEKDGDKSDDKDKTEEKEKEKPEEEKEKEKEKKEEEKEVVAPAEEKKVTGTDVEVLEDKTNRTKSDNYFENPLGKFFMQIGINLVQEHVQTDLLKNQMRKKDKEGNKCSADVHMAISALTKTLEVSKENNKPFHFDLKKCQLCNFRTESQLVMAHHLETPHMKNFVYRCNFCELEVRSPHDILFHMEAEHNVRGRLDRSPAFHQCPNCPFEDNQRGKLSRHLLSCAKKYKPERNQEPPLEWEPPAKIPRVRGARGLPLYPSPSAASMSNAARLAAVPGVSAPLSRLAASQAALAAQRGRGRPPIYVQRYAPTAPSAQKLAAHIRQGGVVFRPSSQPPVMLPTAAYSLTPSLIQQAKTVSNGATAKILQQPSISITPLPRSSSTAAAAASPAASVQPKPGRPPTAATPAKNSFVICEICDGYIKDLEQLRNHMQWIHKVKIHPKMIYNRPPLNCQKCQFRFFTDQGLERHLLGSHGLVTSSMQEAANKGKDGGRCPVCGRVYQWKLLNHVARDHSMSLKPAHLSYKCTVCTATFGMYKQFENHVYSAHSVVAKRVIDKTKTNSSPSVPAQQPSTSNTGESMLKPLKINDEITIIPQPARAKAGVKPGGGATVTPTPVTSKPPVSK